MDIAEARQRVRERASAELVERLEHLDATRGERARDDDAPAAPDAGARADFDVALVGGGLSILYAPVLAAKGLRVAVFERGTAAVAHREWNASLPELGRLVDAGVVTREALAGVILAQYREGVCRWHGGGSYPVTGVLDCAVDAGALLALARRRAEALGVVFHDGHTLVGHATGGDAVALRFRVASGAAREVTARVMIDARGASSPSATADLMCPTVGGVLEGITVGSEPDAIDPSVGEILVTTEGVDDGRQHIWEAFPARAGETTVYLFYYDRTERVGAGSLLALYARFFDALPRYKRGDVKLARPTFGYIPGWSRLTPAPRAPSPRIVLVGDAAARQSPLTYCGFGATLRSLDVGSERIADAVEGRPHGSVVHDTALHAGTGALAHMIASPPQSAARAGELNTLLDAAFSTLHAMGNGPYGAMLRDEMPVRDFVRFLYETSRRHPRVYPEVFRVLGAMGVSRWGVGIARALWEASP
jgi:lycopene cyclase CruA